MATKRCLNLSLGIPIFLLIVALAIAMPLLWTAPKRACASKTKIDQCCPGDPASCVTKESTIGCRWRPSDSKCYYYGCDGCSTFFIVPIAVTVAGGGILLILAIAWLVAVRCCVEDKGSDGVGYTLLRS